MTQHQPIAFFDFDGTITVHDTFITFGRHALGLARLAVCIAAASPWLALWKIGIISNSTAKQRLFSLMFKGVSVDKFAELGESFAATIDQDLRPDTIAMIKKHQTMGHRIVIVSASIAHWIRPWAKSQGIRDVIATEADFDRNGRLTGHFATFNCHGQEKVDRILEQFPDAAEAETYAYGDSGGDDAMLSFAKHSMKIK